MSPLRALVATFLTVAVLSLTARAGCAQLRLAGNVVDENTGEAIRGARVEVFTLGGRRVADQSTDSTGAFFVVLASQAGYRVRATRLGYLANVMPVVWTDDHSFIQLEVRLDSRAVLMAPIEVVARTRNRSPILENYRLRMRSGFGTVITRDQIEQRNPGFVTDLLAMMPGVRLESSGSGLRRTIYFNRAVSGTRDCPAQIFIDGFLMNRASAGDGDDFGLAVDDAVSPNSVEGIEIFRGLSTVPAEFLNEQAECGVVAIWTRRGG
jgi:hypothetical protein